MHKKKKTKVKIHRVVKLKPDTHLIELEVAGAAPPEVHDHPVITKPKKDWLDWVMDKLSGA